jgi:glycosyltransferase involved in cell wall biosynthesis
MKAHPRVSVVIPTYNRVDRIKGAIRSALMQDPLPIEVIVVDDCSTDGTNADDLRSIDARVCVITHESNQGGAVARNAGIDAASGDWIAFLDADDCWFPNKLARQFEQLNNQEQNSLVFACGNVQFDGNTNDGKLYNYRPPRPGEDISCYFLVHRCTFQTSTLLVPTDLARSVRFDARLRRCQDWDFVLRLIRGGATFVYCHEPLAKYWNNADPLRVSQQSSIEATLFWIESAQHLMAPVAVIEFYFRRLFRKHLKINPLAAVIMASKLATASPASAAWLAKRLILRPFQALFAKSSAE